MPDFLNVHAPKNKLGAEKGTPLPCLHYFCCEGLYATYYRTASTDFLPGPFLLGYSVLDFISFPNFFRFWAVR